MAATPKKPERQCRTCHRMKKPCGFKGRQQTCIECKKQKGPGEELVDLLNSVWPVTQKPDKVFFEKIKHVV